MVNQEQMTVSLPPIEAVAKTFDAAAARHQVFDRWFRIAEAVVHARIVGESLVAPLTRALDHLVIEPVENPDLVINCWDRATSGSAPPLPPIESKLTERPVAEVGQEGTILWGSPALVTDSDEGWQLWRTAYGVFSAMTPDSNEAWHWVEAADEIRYWDVAAPFKAILHRWARHHGKQLVHAGSVGTDDGAVLFVGKGGSGKSTTSLVCLEAGLQYLGDDYVMVSLEPDPLVHSVSCAAKLEVPQAQRHPHLMPTIWNADQLGDLHNEKAVAFVDHAPGTVVGTRSLKMVIVPRISGNEGTTISEFSPGGAFLALAPSTVIQMPGSREAEFAAMADLVKKVPTVQLDLGHDLSTIPPVIVDVINS